jgi:hypothetical protein
MHVNCIIKLFPSAISSLYYFHYSKYLLSSSKGLIIFKNKKPLFNLIKRTKIKHLKIEYNLIKIIYYKYYKDKVHYKKVL